jgi:hypothetical protein
VGLTAKKVLKPCFFPVNHLASPLNPWNEQLTDDKIMEHLQYVAIALDLTVLISYD